MSIGKATASEVRTHEFRAYIRNLAKTQDGDRLTSPNLARTALKVWRTLDASRDGNLSVPDVGPGPDGELIFIWKREDHYLSVEMSHDSLAEIFYRNQRTGASLGV